MYIKDGRLFCRKCLMFVGRSVDFNYIPKKGRYSLNYSLTKFQKQASDFILNNDIHFPKTTNLDIKIIEHKEMNALCFPNGNIYITNKLYEKLDTEEKLAFVIAHEMAHYKNKDHLINLRKSISSSAVILSLCILGIEQNISTLVSETMDLSDYKYSKQKEMKADKYAAQILLSLYGNTRGGVEVLNILKKGEYNIEFDTFSTHPSLNKRISYLNKINQKY